MDSSNIIKSTQTWCAVVAFNSELNTHQARLTPCMREMPPFLTPENSITAYFWNHLTTLNLNGLLNTHLQHLGQLLTSEKKKESNKCKSVCPWEVTQDPRGQKGWQPWRQCSDGGESRPESGWKCTNPPVHAEFGWEQRGYVGAWLLWGSLLYIKY